MTFLSFDSATPRYGEIDMDIAFVGELKQDSQTDGIRYTLPSKIAPRYRATMSYSQTQLSPLGVPASLQGMSITVDVQMEKGLVIRVEIIGFGCKTS
ncbi:hypothetical protein N7519_000757 [Penicillium mononematosum]|uniref:uncharacterized protein n=1 Tax=Penicillium mononematosum TaxID=268346 RepID=UPI00254829D4|nr:uncharacterized protein N7519_000757 [Penicillium mononematosum]KAJ6190736.1 hypothetical protein N7519_000757 [Penicillium mononematosum]